jgi:hypothetical protein
MDALISSGLLFGVLAICYNNEFHSRPPKSPDDIGDDFRAAHNPRVNHDAGIGEGLGKRLRRIRRWVGLRGKCSIDHAQSVEVPNSVDFAGPITAGVKHGAAERLGCALGSRRNEPKIMLVRQHKRIIIAHPETLKTPARGKTVPGPCQGFSYVSDLLMCELHEQSSDSQQEVADRTRIIEHIHEQPIHIYNAACSI